MKLALIWLTLVAVSSAAAQEGPGSPRLAMRELRTLQLRAPDLWRQRDDQCRSCGALAIAAGVPVAAIFLSLGAALVGTSARYDDGYYDERYLEEDTKHDRRMGLSLLGIGVIASSLFVWGAWKLRHVKRERAAIDRELIELGARRAVLERELEGALVEAQPEPAR